MRRTVGKVLDALARGFFAAMRGVAAVTGWSLAPSVAGALLLTFFVSLLTVPLAHGLVTAAFDAVLVLALLRVVTIVKKYDAAFAARDFAEVTRIRAIIEGQGEPRSPALRALRKVGDGELLLQFEKWDLAAETFAAIDLADIPAVARPGILTELGYARAHAGKVDKGVADVERGLALADETSGYPKEKRWFLNRRHGIALSLAGEHERAVDVLEDVRSEFAGDVREWAETYFFLGRSHDALGDPQAAGHAFGCAVFGDGPFVARAWKELEKILDPAELDVLREEVANDRMKKN